MSQALLETVDLHNNIDCVDMTLWHNDAYMHVHSKVNFVVFHYISYCEKQAYRKVGIGQFYDSLCSYRRLPPLFRLGTDTDRGGTTQLCNV